MRGDHGAFVERETTADDQLGRREIRWEQLAIRLPDDGTGALPLLRHVILNDDKSSTYKLGLLRVLCRIADGAGGLASLPDDECVAIPMGLVALTWIRLYKPLLAANMPQSPTNHHGGDQLAFAKDAFGASRRSVASRPARGLPVHRRQRPGAPSGAQGRGEHHSQDAGALHDVSQRDGTNPSRGSQHRRTVSGGRATG